MEHSYKPVCSEHTLEAIFQEEEEGWHGYIEWEKYPDKKARAAKILSAFDFDQVRKCSTADESTATEPIE